MPILLMTRPAPASRSFVSQLDREDFDSIISPVLEIFPTKDEAPTGPFDGLIVTSQNAVSRLSAALSTPVYAVGQKTAAAIEKKGGIVALVAQDAAELLATFPHSDPQRLLYARGVYVATPLADKLRTKGHTVEEWVCYEQRAIALTQEAKDAFAGVRPIVLPLFSPRSATILMSQIESLGMRAPLIVAAMSANVADAVSPGVATRCITAHSPDAQSMGTAVRNALDHAGSLEGRAPLP